LRLSPRRVNLPFVVKDITTTNFGLMIAFVVPGLTAIWGASYFSDTLQLWLRGSPTHAPTVGGFMYVTIAAIAAGVTVSAVRWAFLDTLHHHTGIPRPDWDFSRLQQNVQAYAVLLENHYRFYQFYSNLLMSLVFLYTSRRLALGLRSDFGWFDLGFLILVSILFLGSRDTLRLCGRPHKRSYVGELVMWRCCGLLPLRWFENWPERHITDRATAIAGIP